MCWYVIKVRDDAGRWSVYGCYATPSGARAVLDLLQASGVTTFCERRGDAPPLVSSKEVL